MKQNLKKGVFDTLSHLNLALQRIDEQGFVEAPWVSADVRAKVVESTQKLALASTDQLTCGSALTLARNQYREDGDRLSQLVRDFYVILNRTGNRQGQADLVRRVFGQPNPMPVFLRIEGWQELARKIINAGPNAKAMNLPDPVNPTLDDIAAALASSMTSANAFFKAQVAYKACILDVKTKRDEGHRVLRLVANRLRESLRLLPEGARRDMMRTFGFQFANDSESAPDTPTRSDNDTVQVTTTPPVQVTVTLPGMVQP